jgi:hypothetical protein
MNTTTETPIRPGIHVEQIDPEIERIIRERRADKDDPREDAREALAEIRKTFKSLVSR